MDFIKKNISAVIMLIAYTIILISFVNKLDARTEENVKDIQRVEHELIPYEVLTEKFVTRKEYETQLTDVKKDLNEIKSDIKKLLQRSK